METLPDDDPIIRRYGKFKRLRVQSDETRVNNAWILVERLGFGVMLEFEKANAHLGLGITRGPEPAITRLTKTPGKWRDLKSGGRMAFDMFDGRATHPNLCVRDELDSGAEKHLRIEGSRNPGTRGDMMSIESTGWMTAA